MIGQHQLRGRVLEALALRAKQFRSREELWPLRVPADPIPLENVIEHALAEAHTSFDAGSLRSRALLHLEWDDGYGWDAWVIALPSGVKIYCDSGADETRILASGGRNEGDESDRRFLELLAESAGGHFGIEMSGGAPSRVRSAIADRTFLVDLFVELFEVIGAEDSVREQLDGEPDGADFRADVEKWLERALVVASALRRKDPKSDRSQASRT